VSNSNLPLIAFKPKKTNQVHINFGLGEVSCGYGTSPDGKPCIMLAPVSQPGTVGTSSTDFADFDKAVCLIFHNDAGLKVFAEDLATVRSNLPDVLASDNKVEAIMPVVTSV
jgi:hypothetical protein